MRTLKISVLAIWIAAVIGLVSPAHAVLVTYLDPSWSANDFATLTIPTRSLAFDADANMYVERISDDGSGEIRIIRLDAASEYTTPSLFASYDTTYNGVTGLSFDGLGSLYVSERSADGDSGIVRRIDTASQTLAGDVRAMPRHRPTGIHADSSGDIYYTGRRESQRTFGHLFEMNPTGVRSILLRDVVGTGLAVDSTDNIFVSTPMGPELGLEANSIYRFDPADILNPLLIATFDGPAGEITFDAAGNLYAVAHDDHRSIIQLSRVPLPAAGWLLGSGILGWLCLIRRRRDG